MKKYAPLILVTAITAAAAGYTITQLIANNTPSAGTLIEIYDPLATPKSGKMTLDSSAFRVAAGLGLGTDVQPYDADLSTLAAGRRVDYTHAGTVTLDFATNTIQKLVLTGDVTIAFSNLGTNRTFDLLLANSQATNSAITLPSVLQMSFIAPNVTTNKHARLWFEVDAQTNSIVYATYQEQL